MREQAISVFQRAIHGRVFASARPLIVGMLRRLHHHVFNCGTNANVNGEMWLVRQLPPAGTFLDIGFNRGMWTRAVLAQCPGAFVHGFDPCRDVQPLVQELGLPEDRFVFHPIALSNAPGRAIFHDYGDCDGSNSLVDRACYVGTDVVPDTYEVEVTTLNQWVKTIGNPFIDVLKIDAEGFDLHIMEGADGLLDDQRVDMIVFEYESGWFASKRTLFEADNYLSARGYTLYKLFPYFLAPYQYRVQHEGTMIGYFVALSDRMNRAGLPRQTLSL